MFVFYIVFAALYCIVECLNIKNASPSCMKIDFYVPTLRCMNMDNPETLRQFFNKEINRTLPAAIYDVEIVDSNFLYIPHDFLKKYSFRRLTLVNVSLISLSDTDTAFEGLEKSLSYLHIKDSAIFRDFSWYQLRNLSVLKYLILNNIGLEYIDSDVSSISALNLTELALLKNRISYISDKAFAPFVQLQSLSLSYNNVTDLKRSMFPNPAKHLKSIDLSNNKISSLPADFFTNMPALVSVILAENEFLTLDQALFAPIWKNLNKIDVSGNALRCDCRMKWLLRQSFPRNTWGTCDEPLTVHGKDLVKLNDLELWCVY